MNKVAPAPVDIPRLPKIAWSNADGEVERGVGEVDLAAERPPSGTVLLRDELPVAAEANGTVSVSQNMSSSATSPSGAPSSSITLTSQPMRTHEIDAVPDITAAVSSERMVRRGFANGGGLGHARICNVLGRFCAYIGFFFFAHGLCITLFLASP